MIEKRTREFQEAGFFRGTVQDRESTGKGELKWEKMNDARAKSGTPQGLEAVLLRTSILPISKPVPKPSKVEIDPEIGTGDEGRKPRLIRSHFKKKSKNKRGNSCGGWSIVRRERWGNKTS